MSTELHVLNDFHMERRAAGDDSYEALRGTAERLYAQASSDAGAAAGAAGGAQSGPTSGPSDDEVVDAEIVDDQSA